MRKSKTFKSQRLKAAQKWKERKRKEANAIWEKIAKDRVEHKLGKERKRKEKKIKSR